MFGHPKQVERTRSGAVTWPWLFAAVATLAAADAHAQSADVTPPPLPVAVFPTDVVTLNPLLGFVWTGVVDQAPNPLSPDSSRVSGLASYRFELSQFASFSSIIATSTGTSTRYQLTTAQRLTPGSTYYWRVTVRDNAGNEATTPIRVFTVQQRLVRYRMILDDDCSGGFTSPNIDINTTATAATDSRFPLTEGVQYCWRVQAIDLAENVRTTPTRRILLADRFGPSVAVLHQPANDALLIDNTPGFAWTPSRDTGTVTYTVQVATSDQFANLRDIGAATNLTATGYQIPDANALPRGARYFVRVLSRDSLGNVTTGTAVRFSVDDRAARYTLTVARESPASRTFEFNSSTVPTGTALFGNAVLLGDGGFSGGALNLVGPTKEKQGSIIVNDFAGGTAVKSFAARMKIRVDQTSNPPADGWSFNFATDLPNTSFGEEGAGSGLTISFDTFDNGRGEAPAINARWRGTNIAEGRPGIATLITGDNGSSVWADVLIRLDPDGTLDLVYDGVPVFANLQTPYVAQSGARFGIGARNSSRWSNVSVDDLTLTVGTPDLEVPDLTSTSYILTNSSLLQDGQQYFWRVSATDRAGNVRLSRTNASVDRASTFTLGDTYPPPPAEAVFPEDGSVTLTTKPMLTWEASSDARNFVVNVSANANMSSPLQTTALPSPARAIVGTPVVQPLNRGQTYFWTVRSIDSKGNGSDSPIFRFTVDAKAVQYNVQVAQTTTFSTALIDRQGLRATTYTVLQGEALPEVTQLYWRVLATDQAGNSKTSTRFHGMRMADRFPPPTPELTYPENQASIITSRPVFMWDPVFDSSGGVTYRLEISTNDLFSNIVLQRTGLTSPSMTIQPSQALAPGRYFWRVLATDLTNQTAAPAVGTFSVLSRAARYEIALSRQADLSTPFFQSPTSAISFPLPASASLDAGVSYYWQVVAIDGAENRRNSGIRRFSLVDRFAPEPPDLLYPASAATVVNDRVCFAWGTARDSSAVTYRVQVSRNTLFSPLVAESTALTTQSFCLPAALPRDTSYYWRVQVADAAGNTGASTTGSFTVESRSAVYALEVATDSTFNAPVIQRPGLANKAYNLAQGEAVNEAVRYFWRVRASDRAGNDRLSRVAYTFQLTDKFPPAVPDFIFPTADATLINDRPSFSWEATADFSGGVRYTFELATDTLFNEMVTTSLTQTATTLALGSQGVRLGRGRTYYYRLKTHDAAGNVGVGPTQRFDLETKQAIFTYTLLDGSVPVAASGDLTTSSYTLTGLRTPLVEGKAYTWTVQARDRAGNVRNPAKNFTFALADVYAPSLPELQYPDDRADVLNARVGFRWGTSSDPNGVAYRVQVSETKTFDIKLVDQSTTNGLYQLSSTQALPAGKSYFWRVVVADNKGNTAATLPKTFQLIPKALSYTLTVRRSAGDGAIVAQATTTASKYTVPPATPLVDGLSYNWSVDAVDQAGGIRKSVTRQFTLSDIYPPSPAKLTYPRPGETVANPRPSFLWDPAIDASNSIQYTIDISAAADFGQATLIESRSGLTATMFTVSTALAREKTYYWRVRSRDSNGRISNSDTGTFVVGTKKPRYRLELTDGTDAAALNSPAYVLDTPEGITQKNLADVIGLQLREETNYVWRVRAIDASSNEKLSSTFRRFRLADRYPPPAPDLEYPSDVGEVVNSRVGFLWEAVRDSGPNPAVTYGIEVSTVPTFATTVLQKTGLTAAGYQSSFTERLTPDKTYYWRVKAKDVLGFEVATAPRSFTVKRSVVKYTFTLANDQNFSNIQYRTSDLTIPSQLLPAPVGLTEAREYFWNVEARDDAGFNVPALNGPFRMRLADTLPPAPAVLTYPAMASVVADNTPGFAWEKASDPSGATYAIDIARDNKFTDLVVNKQAVGTALGFQMPSTTVLTRDANYFWRVYSKDSFGNESVSAPSVFGVGPKGVKYKLEVATDSGFRAIIKTYTDIRTPYFDTPILEAFDMNKDHFWRVTATDQLDRSVAAVRAFKFNVRNLALIRRGGLEGFYYDGVAFDTEMFRRIDPQVDFPVLADGNVAGDFDTGIGPDTFSVRWRGWFEATSSGTYTFFTSSDDGQRLYIDGALVVDDWNRQTTTTKTAVRNLGAGWHSVVYEMFENTEGAVARLEYSGPGATRQVIPSNLLAVIGNPGDKTPPVSTSAFISAAGPDIATVHVDTNEPTLVTIDYGANAQFGRSVQTSALSYSADVVLPSAPSGTLVYRVTVKDAANNSTVGSNISGCTPLPAQITANEIRARYYTGTNFETLRLARPETTVNFSGASGAVLTAVGATNFSARWDGLYQVTTAGAHTFFATSDDGQRLFIDGVKGVNDWVSHLPTERSYTRTLAVGYRPFTYEMFQNDAGSRGTVEATPPSAARGAIPSVRLARIADSYLAPRLPTLATVGPFEATNPTGTPVTLVTPTATDCRDPLPMVAGNAPAKFPVGTNQVTWTAQNRFGETTQGVQLVTIRDTKAPVLEAGPDLTLRCDSPQGDGITTRSRLTLNTPTVSDLGDAKPLVWDDAPNEFEVDVPVDVTVFAKDASGNEGTDVYTVVVKEGGSLLVNGGGELLVAKADNCTLPNSAKGTRVTLRQPTANGLCRASTPVAFTHSYPTAGTTSREICAPDGSTQVVWTARGGGLTGQDTVNVRVVKSDLVVAVESAPSGWTRTNANVNARVTGATALDSNGALALTWSVRGDRAPSSETVRQDGTYSATFLEDATYCPLTMAVTDARGLQGIAATPPCFGIDRTAPTSTLAMPEQWVSELDPNVAVNVSPTRVATYPHNFVGEKLDMLFTTLDLNGITVSGLASVNASLTDLSTNTTNTLVNTTFTTSGTLPTGPSTADVNACSTMTVCMPSKAGVGATNDTLDLSRLGRGTYKLSLRLTDRAGNALAKDYFFRVVDFTDGLEASVVWVDGLIENLLDVSAEPALLGARANLDTASRLQTESPDHALLLAENAFKQLGDVFVTTGTDTRFLTKYLPRGAKAEVRFITERFQRANLANWSLFGPLSGHLTSPRAMGDFFVRPKVQTDLAVARLDVADEQLRIGQVSQSMASARLAFDALALLFRDDIYAGIYGYPARSLGAAPEAYFNNATTSVDNIARYVAATVSRQIDRVDDDPGIPLGARQPLARVKTNLTTFENGIAAVATATSDNEKMVRNVYMTAAQSLADLDAMQRNALATKQWRTGMALTLAYAMHFSLYGGPTALTVKVPRGSANPLVDVAECRLNRIVDDLVEDRLEQSITRYDDSKCLIVETFNRFYGRGRFVPGGDPCINPADFGCPVLSGASQPQTSCPVIDQTALVAAGGTRWDPAVDCAY